MAETWEYWCYLVKMATESEAQGVKSQRARDETWRWGEPCTARDPQAYGSIRLVHLGYCAFIVKTSVWLSILAVSRAMFCIIFHGVCCGIVGGFPELLARCFESFRFHSYPLFLCLWHPTVLCQLRKFAF